MQQGPETYQEEDRRSIQSDEEMSEQDDREDEHEEQQEDDDMEEEEACETTDDINHPALPGTPAAVSSNVSCSKALIVGPNFEQVLYSPGSTRSWCPSPVAGQLGPSGQIQAGAIYAKLWCSTCPPHSPQPSLPWSAQPRFRQDGPACQSRT
jgi:hypothetical protein